MKIQTKPTTPEYREGWERVFGKVKDLVCGPAIKEPKVEPIICKHCGARSAWKWDCSVCGKRL